MADLDISTLFSAAYGADASGGAGTLVTASIRDGGEEDGQTGHDVQVWGQAPVLYLPADPDEAGACQALATLIGGTPVCLATRDLRAVNALPAMGKGDAAFVCPTGRGGLIAKPDGAIILLQRGTGGRADAVAALEKDGRFSVTTPFGQMSLGSDGFSVILPDGTCFALSAGNITLNGTNISLSASNLALGLGASVPLAALPLTVAATGGGPGFYSPVPITRIFVPPA